jgi:hypothetical protein
MDPSIKATIDNVYDEIKDLLIAGLENNLLEEKEIEKSADFISQHLDKVKDDIELMVFLKKLSQKWNIYTPVYTKYKHQDVKEDDQVQINAIQEKLKQYLT